MQTIMNRKKHACPTVAEINPSRALFSLHSRDLDYLSCQRLGICLSGIQPLIESKQDVAAETLQQNRTARSILPEAEWETCVGLLSMRQSGGEAGPGVPYATVSVFLPRVVVGCAPVN